MEILRLNKSKKSQSQFLFIIIIAGVSLALIGSNFFLFSEINRNNEQISRGNSLEIFGETVASQIIDVYTVGENIDYDGLENKLIFSKEVNIDSKYRKYIVNASSDKIVITHKDKKKEIKIHHLSNIEVKGTFVGKDKLKLSYFKNKTSKSIKLS